MNAFVIAGAVFLIAAVGWYAWFTGREARRAGPPEQRPGPEKKKSK